MDAPSLALVILLIALTLGVFKPWGTTGYGQRIHSATAKMVQSRSAPSRASLWVLLAVCGLFVVLVVALHLAGGGFH